MKSKITIGLPTYNGEKFIRQAIESLLDQTYAKFILVICDDASTDATYQICAEFVDDERISLSQNEQNVGAQKNLENILSKVESEFFVWASQDDYWAPDFLKLLIEKLENNKALSLAFSDIVMIRSECKSEIYSFNHSWTPFSNSKYGLILSLLLPVNNFSWFKTNLVIHGVVRTSALKKSLNALKGEALHDRIYILFMIFCGGWGYINAPLYFRRTYTGTLLRSGNNDPIHVGQESFYLPILSGIKMLYGFRLLSKSSFGFKGFVVASILGYVLTSYCARSVSFVSYLLHRILPKKYFIKLRSVYRYILRK